MSMYVDFQAYAGPGDKGLKNNELEGCALLDSSTNPCSCRHIQMFKC